jgi:hypothetical protein
MKSSEPPQKFKTSRVKISDLSHETVPLTLCFLPDLEPAKLLYRPKQKPKRVRGLRQINTCRKVPLQVNFVR